MLSSARRLVNEATEDEGALTDFIVSSSRTVSAVADKRDDLSALVGNANATTGAIAAESRALSEALGLLPTTLRRGNSTFVNLRSTLDDLDPLVRESKPATEDLAPFLRELRPLVRDAKPTIADLSTLVRRPGADNDLVEATQKLPGFQRVASPAMRNSTGALRKSQPVLEFIRPYVPELVGWFRDFGVGAANYDANGHYARIQPIFNAFQLKDQPVGPSQLVPLPVAQRLAGLQTGMLRRCPGSASQPAPDGSAPYRDSGGNLDCDPTQVVAGP
jgi:phospholipid/cholesterol/gamma-HCH transport system substrate-binding protein